MMVVARRLLRVGTLAAALSSSSLVSSFSFSAVDPIICPRSGNGVGGDDDGGARRRGQQRRRRSATSRLSMATYASRNKGCAAKPFEKKRIAIFGAGGYLGATVFGFLQRASSLYGTGIAGVSSPRAICATSVGLEALNKVLLSSFRLAFAGEDLVRLVDASDSSHVSERLKGFDAAIIGTTYQLEQRGVTGNTYETSPNEKTFEFYLGERYGANENGAPENDSDMHIILFEAAIEACKIAGGIEHLVVLETPRTLTRPDGPADFLDALDRGGLPYTYVRVASPLMKDKLFVYEKGVAAGDFDIRSLPPGSDRLAVEAGAGGSEETAPCTCEDVAAILVQSLMTLDWTKSRVLEVTAIPKKADGGEEERTSLRSKPRFDKEWCPNSEIIAKRLAGL